MTREYVFKHAYGVPDDEYKMSGVITRKMFNEWKDNGLYPKTQYFLTLGLTYYNQGKPWKISDVNIAERLSNQKINEKEAEEYLGDILYNLVSKGYAKQREDNVYEIKTTLAEPKVKVEDDTLTPNALQRELILRSPSVMRISLMRCGLEGKELDDNIALNVQAHREAAKRFGLEKELAEVLQSEGWMY